MKTKKHIIIFSHGFGVRKDDNGLLTEIAKAIPEAESILFDYYQFNERNNTLTICPFSKQVEMLLTVINQAKKDHPEATIDLICHSQGTIVAGLAAPIGIRKTILLSPPFDMSLERSLKRYTSKPDAVVNINGISVVPSSSGLVRIIPPEYWVERKEVRAFEAYNNLAEKTELIIIEANQDMLIEKVDLKELSPKIKLAPLDGDHGFSGKDRGPLLAALRGYII
ncbi:MAG: hypothetical protein WC027_01285 [Candidatus Paceibacterota bacterium]